MSDDLEELIQDVVEKQEKILHKAESNQKRLAAITKTLRKVADSKGSGRLPLTTGDGQPTEEAFEVLRWITKNGRQGVTTKEFGKKYDYTSRSGRADKKDELDNLFGDLIKIVKPQERNKPHRIVNPLVRKYSKKRAMEFVEAEYLGKITCSECSASLNTSPVVAKDVEECPGCGNDLYQEFRQEVSSRV